MKFEKILVGGHKKIFPDEILYLKGSHNYSQVFLTNGKTLLVSTTLKTLESRFKNNRFFRTHKSSLINLDFVKSYIYDLDGGEIELTNNQTIAVSRRKNRILKTLLFTNS
jgi:two-component system, LytTR family, response regulator